MTTTIPAGKEKRVSVLELFVPPDLHASTHSPCASLEATAKPIPEAAPDRTARFPGVIDGWIEVDMLELDFE